MHRLLERQLKKSLGRTDGLDPAMQKLVDAVQAAYEQNDQDRAMLERSMELSSRELLARNGALAEAEKKYRTIFENATEGIFRIAPEHYFFSANPALARMFGYDSANELTASVPNFLDQLCVDTARREEFLAALKREGMASQFESKARRKDGSLLWVSTSSRSVLDGDGKLVHFEGTIRDITKRKQAEQERQEMQSNMIAMSRQAGMAEVATGVLHNVGNVLNSINVSASLVSERLRTSKLSRLSSVVDLFKQHEADLTQFLSSDEKGRQLPTFLARLAEHLMKDQNEVLAELGSLVTNLEHVKKIVTMQQNYAKTSGVNELVSLPDLIEDAIRLNTASFERHGVELVREFEPLPHVSMDKHRVLQILINLISNARHALTAKAGERKIIIKIAAVAGDATKFFVQISDNGVGIPTENLTRIFAHGFTTKPNGHGFGLHSSSLAAKGMGGSLTAHSGGPGTGATFTLEMPLLKGDEGSMAEREKAA